MTLIHNRSGQQLAVYTFGVFTQPALVFCNSLGTDYQMWNKQISVFAQDYFVICYDTRGHGKSDRSESITMSDLANDIVDILDHFHIKKSHFCGISMGGLIGLQLAIQAPQRLLSLTIAHSDAKIGQKTAWLERAQNVEIHGLDEIVHTAHIRWFSTKFDYLHDATAQKTIQSLSVMQAKGYAAVCRALAHTDLCQSLHKISIPCLVICGSLDAITTVEDGRQIQSGIKNAELVILEAAHLSNIEAPTEFNQTVKNFLTRHSS